MGRNAGIKDNTLNAVASAWILLLSYFAFYGLGNLKGFLNETEDEIGFFLLDQVEFIFAYPLKRYLHLAVIPSFIGLFILTIERLPGKFWKNKTIAPVNLAILTAVIITVQLIPAMIFKTSPTPLIDLTNPTWFSDIIMYSWGGYAAFTLIFLITLLLGFFHAISNWMENGAQDQSIIFNGLLTLGILVLSYLSFTGLGQLDGFFAEEGATSFNDYVLKNGFLNFLRGPMLRYTHLIAVPGLIGLGHLMWKKVAKMKTKIKRVTRRKTVRKKKQTEMPNYGILGVISFVFIFLQTGVAIFIGSPHTWLSDFILVPWGYSVVTGSFFIGQIYGLFRAVFGGLIDKNRK